MRLMVLATLAAVSGAIVAHPETPHPNPGAAVTWPRHLLQVEAVIPIESPPGRRFDASGLLRTHDGTWLTLADRGARVFQLHLPDLSVASTARLTPLGSCFTDGQLEGISIPDRDRLDGEGLAQDAEGRLYLCEESQRWIFRCDPASLRLERLPIDWSAVTNSFSPDRNASFEGIAIGGSRLYVANERAAPLIVVVDLATLRVVDHFAVFPLKGNWLGTHYSDLAWFNERLFVLCRQQQVVLEVDVREKRVIEEFDYAAVENALGYPTFGLVGLMEGLAVDDNHFWLLIDNNGMARGKTSKDTRPVLLKCPRPARSSKNP